MDARQLAIEALQNRKAEIDLEIEALQMILLAPAARDFSRKMKKPRRKRTAVQREAQSRKMKKIWAARRKAAKMR
jgi:hypothetical protein